MAKCIVLLSGGLDSLLALRLMTVQGIEAVALHSVNCFHGTERIEAKKTALTARAAELGAADIVFPNLADQVVDVTKNPHHGYGKHLNACIDCRLLTVRAGFDEMERRGADFVVTGEVVGQRPMSQRRDAIALADRKVAEWGHQGRLLRPLSAKLLDTTVPERDGLVDPARLYDISGRARDRQMALAQELDLGDYPSPAGGCLLTDPGFSQRLAVLMTFTPDWHAEDAHLLKTGRHFQVTPEARIIASRREEENYTLRELSRPDDVFFINNERHGAVVMVRGVVTDEVKRLAAGVAVYYSKMRENGRAMVQTWRCRDGEDVDVAEFSAAVVDPDVLRAMEMDLAGKDCLKKLRNRKRPGTAVAGRPRGEALPNSDQISTM